MSESKSRNPIGRFFAVVWNGITWTRRVIANLLFLLIVVIIVVAISQRQSDVLPESFALELTPYGTLVDERQALDALSALGGESALHSETIVRDLVRSIDLARDDRRVSHLLLNLNYLNGGGISKLHEIAQAIERFKQSGKPVIAMADQYMQDRYYLASHADTVYLHDMGFVLLTGYGSYRLYYKEAIERLGLNFHIFRAGKFKDAIEPYSRTEMSEASREHNRLWVNQLWSEYTARVESMRELEKGKIDQLINHSDQALASAGGDTSHLALAYGLVDKVASRQQMRAELVDLLGYDKHSDSYKSVDWYRYLDHNRQLPLPGKSYIALINAVGPIYDGEQPPGTIGSDSMIQLLRQVRQDGDIKALVIRVDSPGGSAFASEIIRAEIATTRDAGIPVYISMGSVAASGGYWIASAGEQIWALPTTITGSIGAFSLIPTLEESLAKLGVYTDGVGSTALADALNPTRSMSEETARLMQLSVDSIYQRFITTVANARDMSVDAVDKIGQGRVWSGKSALELGLVDRLGTLQDTLQAAAEAAELEKWEVKTISAPLTPMEELLQRLGSVSVPLPTQLKQAVAGWNQMSSALASVPLTDTPGEVMSFCLECQGN
ncbi:signal peptide peptidase SppA [Gilvimarinus sp. DA14]|uniref:signal peptide peptidase SppA n=1 Tax=Gilvimarinus sp. DA14 TaxID=2956798 RepID=UPI0020B78FF4|nr:signal peptide peptidase SppA [Gilvimarinus sp. DA14]UTF60356.1 signal peptide peptidase SppA [Gilvimarinus sp. DA14]